MPAFLTTPFLPMRRSITPKGQAGTQYPHPLQMSSWTTTVPNSLRKSDPVGQTSRQAADVQCLQTSEDMSHRNSSRSPGGPASGAWTGAPRNCGAWPGASGNPETCGPVALGCSMKATWRQVLAPSAPVLS